MDELFNASAAEVTEWLERALAGREALPLATREEPVEQAIARAETELPSRVRDDLRTAVRALFRGYLDGCVLPSETADALLGLARLLQREEVRGLLPGFVASPRYLELPLAERRRLVATLADLRPNVDPGFWLRLAQGDPEVALWCLGPAMRSSPGAALGVLALVPDEEPAAAAVFVKLDQAAAELDPPARAALLDALGEVGLGPTVGAAVAEWVAEARVDAKATSPRRPVRRALLDAFLVRRGGAAARVPMSARLTEPRAP